MSFMTYVIEMRVKTALKYDTDENITFYHK